MLCDGDLGLRGSPQAVGSQDNSLVGYAMQIEMTIKGLMVDPITNTPIVILRDKEGQKVLPIWVGICRSRTSPRRGR